MLQSGHYLNWIDSAKLIRILQALVIGIGLGWHLKIRFFWIQDLSPISSKLDLLQN